MAVVLIRRIDGTKMSEYQCASTDLTSAYPTKADCDAGSTMAVIDETNHIVAGYKYFDGTNWNSV